MNIALIGMMGTMKSSTAKELFLLTGMTVYDTDLMIEEREGMSVADIFAAYGEEFFREKETETLSSLVCKDKIIIACGGGAVIKEENRLLLKKCRVVLLTATAEEICKRLSGDTVRPLIAGDITEERINTLLAQREAVYSECADITVDTCGRTPVEVAAEIVANLG